MMALLRMVVLVPALEGISRDAGLVKKTGGLSASESGHGRIPLQHSTETNMASRTERFQRNARGPEEKKGGEVASSESEDALRFSPEEEAARPLPCHCYIVQT